MKKRAIFGWVMYDWANSSFATTVLAAFFPVFFDKFWCGGASTTRLGVGDAIAGLIVAALSPLLGAFADAGRSRKRFLASFLLLGTVMTGMLATIGQGRWGAALTVFILANTGFACGNLFYDSLLPIVAPSRMDFVSSLGYSVGYIGGGVLFAVNILMVAHPQAFGLMDKTQAVRMSFVTVSAWWLLFALPLLLLVKEPAGDTARHAGDIARTAVRQLSRTFQEVRTLPHIWLFLLAYWLYIDGVNTFILMAANLGISIGLKSDSLMVSLLIVQLVAFPSSLGFGALAEKIGTRTSILIGIGIYIGITVFAPFWVHSEMQYRLVAILAALPLGCLQALSRSYFARLVPADRSAEFFGFYNFIGKFAAILGPAMVAGVALAVTSAGHSPALAARLGFLSITVLFLTGGILLVRAGKAAGAPVK